MYCRTVFPTLCPTLTVALFLITSHRLYQLEFNMSRGDSYRGHGASNLARKTNADGKRQLKRGNEDAQQILACLIVERVKKTKQRKSEIDEDRTDGE